MFVVKLAEDAHGKYPFELWIRNQSPVAQVVVDAAVQELLRPLGTDVCRTEFGKALGRGLYELRIRNSPKTFIRRMGRDLPDITDGLKDTVLLRVFFAVKRGEVLLLGGINKTRRSSLRAQSRAIESARSVLAFQSVRSRNM